MASTTRSVITAANRRMDYYPFGSVIQNRSWASQAYRFSISGKEHEDELQGVLSFEYRIYDPRIARFLSCDPKMMKYPWYTPYQYAGNNPIFFIDIEGLEPAAPEYTTKRGDTYWALSRKFGVSVQDLRKWNGYADTKVPTGGVLFLGPPNGAQVATKITSQIGSAMSKAWNESGDQTPAATENGCLITTKAGIARAENEDPVGGTESATSYGTNYCRSDETSTVQGDMHTHPYTQEASASTPSHETKDACFSGEDFTRLRALTGSEGAYERKLFPIAANYTMLLETENKRFALTITDPAKAQAFFSKPGNDPETLEKAYLDLGKYLLKESGLTYAQATEQALKSIIGSSEESGIQFSKVENKHISNKYEAQN